jgi:hypothetical protein
VFLASAVALAASLVPAPLRAAIIIRSAGYERGFSDRPGKAVVAVIAGKSGAAAEDGKAMAQALGQLLGTTSIGGRQARVVTLTHDSNAKTIEELRAQNAEIVYVANGLEGLVAALPASEGAIKRIIVCADGADVGQGCTLGVELSGDKPRLVLNLKQANAAGLRFDPGLLRLARIVR